VEEVPETRGGGGGGFYIREGTIAREIRGAGGE
jgi:hypothetical protein